MGTIGSREQFNSFCPFAGMSRDMV